MQGAFARLVGDFFSTILFLALYLATGSIVLATTVAIAGAIGQIVHAHLTGKELSFMTWASLGLVMVLGGVTLLTQDPRFVMAKPSLAHFAIGAVMLKRDWMLRYMPPIVAETIPDHVRMAGYGWAILMFVLGAGTIAVAATGDLRLWAIYISFVSVGAKIVAFAVQYVVFRILVATRLRAARA
jgi:intracellular septation protein